MYPDSVEIKFARANESELYFSCYMVRLLLDQTTYNFHNINASFMRIWA